jgi:hypothetical protein
MNFDSDDTSVKSKREKIKLIADALIEMQNMKSRNFSQQFEMKTKQRDQYHKEILLKQKETIVMIKMQHEKKMMRLKIESKKTFHRNSN